MQINWQSWPLQHELAMPLSQERQQKSDLQTPRAHKLCSCPACGVLSRAALQAPCTGCPHLQPWYGTADSTCTCACG
jgi:hypothetical protein